MPAELDGFSSALKAAVSELIGVMVDACLYVAKKAEEGDEEAEELLEQYQLAKMLLGIENERASLALKGDGNE